MKKYVIGVDFGTLSARALLVDAESGEEIGSSVFEYPHGVMDVCLPSGRKLPALYALQHPGDYVEALQNTIPKLLSCYGVSKSEVKALGIDFTACTLMPVDENGVPLCLKAEFANEPHAFVKLWKHHSAQKEAERVNEVAKELGEKWAKRYSGKVSCEWAAPKILEIVKEAPEIYTATHRFTEAGDWICRVITGRESHSAAFAGYKALWSQSEGYPSREFFKTLHKDLENIVGTKLSCDISPVSDIAGHIDQNGADITSLEVGTPVALAMIDAHAAMSALGIHQNNVLMMVLGTSTCHIVNSDTEKEIDGVCGVVKDGVFEGCYTYEAGQACCGDHFDWFIKNALPAEYLEDAKSRGVSPHLILREKAQKLRAGESGLLALDWFNGNRSTLMDADLSGMILGMTLATRPEEIYRALIEATAYGTKMIIDAFVEGGICVDRIVAGGGIAKKDELLMQIYADVTGREITVGGSSQAGAYGSALYAIVAAGIAPSINEAAKRFGKLSDKVYRPIPENVEVYKKLYAEYKTLYNYFGKENGVMKRLMELSKD